MSTDTAHGKLYGVCGAGNESEFASSRHGTHITAVALTFADGHAGTTMIIHAGKNPAINGGAPRHAAGMCVCACI